MFRHAPAENQRKNKKKRNLTGFVASYKPAVVVRAQLQNPVTNNEVGSTNARNVYSPCRRIKVLEDHGSATHAGVPAHSPLVPDRDELDERRARNAHAGYGKQEHCRIQLLTDSAFKPTVRSKRVGVGGSGGANKRLLALSSPGVQQSSFVSGNIGPSGTQSDDETLRATRSSAANLSSSLDHSSLVVLHEDLRESKRQWHYEQQRRKRTQLEIHCSVVDQGSRANVGQLLGLLLCGSLWPDRSPLVVQYWVTQLSESFTLAQCIHQLLMNRAQLAYSARQSVQMFEQAPLLCLPLELLEHRARLALQTILVAFSVHNATYVMEDRANAVPRESFFSVRSLSSNGQCHEHHRGFRFNDVLEHMLSVARVALVRDMACEVLRIGFRVMASSAAVESISCALQQAFCQVRRAIAPLEERAMRGATLDMYLERIELEQLFRLQQREQMLLTLIGCTHRGVLHMLVAQYVERGERAMQQVQNETQ